jgi:hypothetical protein
MGSLDSTYTPTSVAGNDSDPLAGTVESQATTAGGGEGDGDDVQATTTAMQREARAVRRIPHILRTPR